MTQIQLGQWGPAIVLIVAAVLFAVAWRVFARRLSTVGLLTTDEWRLLGKLAMIVVLAIVLLQTKISREFPAEQFIYGRF